MLASVVERAEPGDRAQPGVRGGAGAQASAAGDLVDRQWSRTTGGAAILMIEPAATLSTGDYAGPVPDHITATTGLA